jgi:hypothetical protein
VTVDPLIVHIDGVREEKVTARPEEAVALSVNGAVPQGLLPSALKVIVCANPEIVIAKFWIAFGSTPFAAVSMPAKVPLVFGLPLMRPLMLFSASPGGSEFAIAKNVGAGVPLAVTV